MDLKKCNICLLDSNHLTNVSENDSNNVKWYTKIISIAPELVNKRKNIQFVPWTDMYFSGRP